MPIFSERHGITPEEATITVRNDAPKELREALWNLAEQAGANPIELAELILRVTPISNYSRHRPLAVMGREALQECDWPHVYDLAEAIADALWHRDGFADKKFAHYLNDYFRKQASVGRWSTERSNYEDKRRSTRRFVVVLRRLTNQDFASLASNCTKHSATFLDDLIPILQAQYSMRAPRSNALRAKSRVM
jgi:AbiJ N-terminal domain 4